MQKRNHPRAGARGRLQSDQGQRPAATQAVASRNSTTKSVAQAKRDYARPLEPANAPADPHHKLREKACEVAADDRAWFAANPGREFRARLASSAEAEAAQAFGGVTPEQIEAGGPGAVVVTLVHRMGPGLRGRCWNVATTKDIPDTEEWARWAWLVSMPDADTAEVV
jgi:hypothetical protein